MVALSLLTFIPQLDEGTRQPFIVMVGTYIVLQLMLGLFTTSTTLRLLRITPDFLLAIMLAHLNNQIPQHGLISNLALTLIPLMELPGRRGLAICGFMLAAQSIAMGFSTSAPILASMLALLPLLVAITTLQQHYSLLSASIPSSDLIPGLNNLSTLMQAARFFIPYQQRHLAPFSLVTLKLVMPEHLSKRSNRALHRLAEHQLGSLFETRLRRCDVTARIANNSYAILLTDCGLDGAKSAITCIQDLLEEWAVQNAIRVSSVAALSLLPDSPTALEHLLKKQESALATTPASLPTARHIYVTFDQ
ncbi:hypothetical protein [Fluviicoccus keumensis]|nr:hypothetical protein [Fluviicoccus keumensis]